MQKLHSKVIWPVVFLLGTFLFSPPGIAAPESEAERAYPWLRSEVFYPLFSLFIPGVAQWSEGQYAYGAFYTGGALAAASYGGHFGRKVNKKYEEDKSNELPPRYRIDNKDPDVRRNRLGVQTTLTLGFVSGYQSFQSGVRQGPGDRYSFLSAEESPGDLALAPFHFSYLLRPTTYIPLAFGAGLLIAILRIPRERLAEENLVRQFTGQDAAYAGIYSYNAGVGEEAAFRGWLMPMFRAHTGSDVGANVISSLLFGIGHRSASNRNPWFQTMAGYYLGFVSQKNHWTLGENIFIHAWWDVLTISAGYAFSPLDKSKGSPTIWLPPIEISF